MNNVNKFGRFKKGWKENKKGQEKKHHSQMTKEELDYLVYHLKQMKYNFKIDEHLKIKRKRNEISFDILTIQKTLGSKSLIKRIKEYSSMTRQDGIVDRRVLVQSLKKERVYIKNYGYKLCYLYFVISIDRSEIITAYYSSNKHKKFNGKRYSSDLQILL